MSAKLPTVTKPCEKCGADVTRPAHRFGLHAFCSRQCYTSSEYRSGLVRQALEHRWVGRRVIVPCDQCGDQIDKQKNELRSRNFCNADCYYLFKRQNTSRQVNRLGYVLIYVGKDVAGATASGHMLEHRWVMQQLLGRALEGDENVHHKNGDRADNRLENLELWIKSQPPGQRASDQIAWARQILDRYSGTPLGEV